MSDIVSSNRRASVGRRFMAAAALAAAAFAASQAAAAPAGPGTVPAGSATPIEHVQYWGGPGYGPRFYGPGPGFYGPGPGFYGPRPYYRGGYGPRVVCRFRPSPWGPRRVCFRRY